jgi:hypothetical protein
VTAGTLGAVIDAQKLMQARSEGRTVPITSYSVEEAVANGTFRFAPPLIDRSPRPKALYVVWRAFQFVFDEIDDPATFPPIQVPLPDDALDICRRYVAAAEDLAESELLCGDDEITIRWDRDDGESVESRFTSKEITRGFSVLLRQFDSNDERASFHNVYRALSTASAATTDSHAQRRARHLEGWLQARRLLQKAEIQRLARRKMGMEFGNEHPPSFYFRVFNYGDLLHYGKHRGVLAGWSENDLQRHRFGFVEAAASVALIYVGFSELVRTAVRQAAT